MRRVVITGLGAVSCIGNSKDFIPETLVTGNSFVQAVMNRTRDSAKNNLGKATKIYNPVGTNSLSQYYGIKYTGYLVTLSNLGRLDISLLYHFHQRF